MKNGYEIINYSALKKNLSTPYSLSIVSHVPIIYF